MAQRQNLAGIDELYGSFASDKPAEELISEIRADRRFDREAAFF